MTKKRIPNQAARPGALLKKEYGIWVLQTEPTDVSIVDLIDKDREAHIRKQMCLASPDSD